MIQDEIKKMVEEGIAKPWGPKTQDHGAEILVERPDNRDFGDYATSIAFLLAKIEKRSPDEIAKELAAKLSEIKPASVEKVEAVGGYVNFFLAPEYLREQLGQIYKTRGSFGRSKFGRGKTVIVEYSQPNIAKPMHVGHLRTTTLGDTLANIYEMLGHKVIRWNYIGDWGTQFGKLIAAYKLWGNSLGSLASKHLEAKLPSENNYITVHGLVSLYVKFHEEVKVHPELDRRGQEEFRKLEEGDKENLKLWRWFREESLKEFDRMYKLLGIKFNQTIGESFFEKELKPLVAGLIKNGIAEIGEEGAIIIKLDRFNLPPALIQKADGASLYLTRDIAALKYRIKKYKPAKILYVVGNEQTLHFQQLAAIAGILELKPVPEHIKYGLILGEDKKKLATREGKAILFEDLVNKAVELAEKIVAEKRPDASEKEKSEIARTVALGALKYEILKEHRNSDIVFDWRRMLDFSGNSGPYLQYTYARLTSILRRSNLRQFRRFDLQELQELCESSELAIIKHLLDFPDTIVDSARTNLTNNLALYLYELANLANRFYETVPILKDEDTPRLNARLVLVETTASILKSGLGLLGIQVLNRI